VESVEHVLMRADASDRLPRLGGIARVDGVVIVSERYWAFARRDGSLVEGEMRCCHTWLRRVPLLRGVVRLALAMAPLGAAGVSNVRDRLVLAFAVLASVGLAFLPAAAQVGLGGVLTLGLLGWVFRGRTLHLHGAEHRSIAAAESGQLIATWAGRQHPSRYSERCGTNFAVLALGLVAALYVLLPAARQASTALPLQLGALGATMELWFAVQGSRRRWAKACLLPGLALQRLTTREPALDETRVALRAASSVLRRELAL
jgi:uncharacterized protein YqhQ